MRKILIAFSLSLFFLSGLFGFGVVRQVRAIAEREPDVVTPANQLNLILVHVDSLATERPGLTSIWGIFISRSEFPTLILKRIYPETGSTASARLGAAFSIDQQKQLDPKFMKLMRELDLPAAEIVVVDNEGLEEIVAVISHPFPKEPSPGNAEKIQTTDLELFQDTCSAINAPTKPVPFSSPGIAPPAKAETMGSSFGFLNKWKGLVTSLHFASCEVLAGP